MNRRRITQPLLVLAGTVTGMAVAIVVTPTGDPIPAPDVATHVSSRPHPQADRLDRLVERHECWTGAAPADVIPGHAVVTLPGTEPQLVSSDVGFALWLGPDAQPGTNDERPGQLHAFCP